MNLNKLGIVALSVVTMMTPVSTVVLAEDPTPTPDAKNSNITYTIDSSYEWQIHSDLNLNNATSSNPVSGDVTVTKANIASNQNLTIAIKGSGTDGAFTMKDLNGTGTNEIAYSVNGGNVTTGSTILTVTAGETMPKAVSLKFALASSDVKAGNYKGQVIYTATLNTTKD